MANLMQKLKVHTSKSPNRKKRITLKQIQRKLRNDRLSGRVAQTDKP
ncbi:hypothetical protein J2S43_003726 [Catenuloplanes nepalensis]|uniref:Uncharacterized protein n=1 Tax=Catenuloplanes nepalensis TaxID=587533 RepID=A0ABT9MV13_9ACTN|nr:hypothetical protein [Catenuloplanes nepalensis]